MKTPKINLKIVVAWYRIITNKNWFKVLRASLVTFIPNTVFYHETFKKLNKDMNILQFYKENLNMGLFLLVLGFTIAILLEMYFKQKRTEKLIKKAILDHAIRINLYHALLKLIIQQNTSEIQYKCIATITPKQKQYLGFDVNKINTDDKFELDMLGDAMTIDKEEAWQMLSDEFNKNNPIL